jgi:HEAT repeat protein
MHQPVDVADFQKYVNLLSSTDDNVMGYVCSAITKINDIRAVDALVAALANKSGGEARRNIAWALGEIGSKNAVTALCEALRDSDGPVRWSAVIALGKIGDKRAVEPIISCLQDTGWTIRQEAADVLGKLGDKRAIIPLQNALLHPDENTQIAAAKALKELTAKQ